MSTSLASDTDRLSQDWTQLRALSNRYSNYRSEAQRVRATAGLDDVDESFLTAGFYRADWFSAGPDGMRFHANVREQQLLDVVVTDLLVELVGHEFGDHLASGAVSYHGDDTLRTILDRTSAPAISAVDLHAVRGLLHLRVVRGEGVLVWRRFFVAHQHDVQERYGRGRMVVPVIDQLDDVLGSAYR